MPGGRAWRPRRQDSKEGREAYQLSPDPDEPTNKDKKIETEQPLDVDYLGVLHGYKIAATADNHNANNYIAVDVAVSRAPSAFYFIFFIGLLMICLSGAAVFVLLSVVIRGRKAELPMFAWFATLLFALPTLRNSLPGTPTVGTYFDYLVFFWALALVAVCLVGVVSTWLRRPGVKG